MVVPLLVPISTVSAPTPVVGAIPFDIPVGEFDEDDDPDVEVSDPDEEPPVSVAVVLLPCDIPDEPVSEADGLLVVSVVLLSEHDAIATVNMEIKMIFFMILFCNILLKNQA